MPKPFRISGDWIEYCFRPGADSGYPTATELCDWPGGSYLMIPPERADLVEEIVSVSELYSGGYRVDDDERRRAKKAQAIINRARAWLREVRDANA